MPRMLFFLELLQRKPWLVTWFGGIVLLWLVYSVSFSRHGIPSYLDEARELRLLQVDLARVRKEREEIARRVLLLRQDRAYLESVIHRELGYVYPDEYILIREDTPTP